MQDKKLKEASLPTKFDNTMISTYCQCKRKLYYFLRRIEPLETPGYFCFGRAFGQGINKWHETEGQAIEERKNLALVEAQRIWDTELPIEKGNDTRENLVILLGQYMELYPEKELWDTLATEVGFCLPIPGTNLFYAGALDSYLNWKGYGLLNREDKTTGAYFTQNYLAQWEHSSQVSGYQWALGEVTGEKPFGTLMNLVSKRPQKELTKKFSRDLIEIHPWRIEEFMEGTVRICGEIQEEWNRWTWDKTGERHPTICAGGPGTSPCTYRRLCLRPIKPWDLDDESSLLSENELKLNPLPWTPWEREGSDE